MWEREREREKAEERKERDSSHDRKTSVTKEGSAGERGKGEV